MMLLLTNLTFARLSYASSSFVASQGTPGAPIPEVAYFVNPLRAEEISLNGIVK